MTVVPMMQFAWANKPSFPAQARPQRFDVF
jgi:hypothetical protein